MPLMMTMINFIRARLWQDKAIQTQGFKLDNDDKLFRNKKKHMNKKTPIQFLHYDQRSKQRCDWKLYIFI